MSQSAGAASAAGLEPPSAGQLCLGMAVGSSALLMLGLQPLLLGALAGEGRLTLDQLGLAATAELLALGLTTGLLASLLPPARIRAINVAACVVLAGADGLGMLAHGLGFVATRGLAGAASGCLVWIAIVMITRGRAPDRLSGIFLTAQTLAQAALAALLPLTVMVHHGANGGLAALALLALLCGLASIGLQDRFAALPRAEDSTAPVSWRGAAGLASVFLYMAGIVGLWVFVERLGADAGASATLAGIAVAAALAAQVTGSSTATFLSGRLPTVATLLACAIGNIAVVVLLGSQLGPMPYLLALMLFGFLWLFAMPFQTRFLIELDSTRRSAMLLSAAQLLGSAAGPVITSAFATDTSLAGALLADGLLFGSALVLTASLWRAAKPRP